MALQRETEIAQIWQETNVGKLYDDPYFPPDGRSLYFDPLYPPKGNERILLKLSWKHEDRLISCIVAFAGALPADSLAWSRVLNSEIAECDDPITIANDHRSVLITQGALGDNHFVSALRGSYLFLYCVITILIYACCSAGM